MNKILLTLVLLVGSFTSFLYPQIDKNLLLFGQSKYYLWNAHTGSNLVTDTDIFLYGSYLRTQVPKDSLDDFGDGLVRAGTKTASKYIVVEPIEVYWFDKIDEYSLTDTVYPFIQDGWQTVYTGSGVFSYYDIDSLDIGRTGVLLLRKATSHSIVNFQTRGLLKEYDINGVIYGQVDYEEDWYYGWQTPYTYIVSFDYYIPSSNPSITEMLHMRSGDAPYDPYSNNATVFNVKDEWTTFVDTITFYSMNPDYELVTSIYSTTFAVGDYVFIDNYQFRELTLPDSVRTLARTIDATDLLEDTEYIYYASILQPNGRYSKGADSTFITPLTAPSIYDIQLVDGKAQLAWDARTTAQDTTIILRSTNGIDYAVLEKQAPPSLTGSTTDSTLLSGETYYYGAYNVGTYVNSDTIFYPTGIATPLLELEFLPTAISDMQDTLSVVSILAIDSTLTDSTQYISGGEDAIDLETGDFTQFDNAVTEGSNTQAVSDTADIHGTYGAVVTFSGNNAEQDAYQVITIAGTPDTVRTRAYFIIDPDFAMNDTYSNEFIFTIQDGNVRIVSLALRNHTASAPNAITHYQLDVSVGSDNNTMATVAEYPLGDTIYVELLATINATTGSVGLWINGEEETLQTGLNTSALEIDRIWIGGAYAGGSNYEPTAGSWLKFDDVVYNTTGAEIGEYGGVSDTTWGAPYTYDYDTTYSTTDTVYTVVATNPNQQDVEVLDISWNGSANITVDDRNETLAKDDTLQIKITLDKNTPPQTLDGYVVVNTDQIDDSIRVTIAMQEVDLATDWDYVSDYSISTDGWTSYGTGTVVTANVDGISDGITTKNNVLKIMNSSYSGFIGVNTDFMGNTVGKRMLVQYEYLIPNAGNITSINYAGANTGTGFELISGLRSSNVIGEWTLNEFEVVWNDTYNKQIVCNWNGITTPDSFYIGAVRWKEITPTAELDTTAPNAVTNFVATGQAILSIPQSYVTLDWTASTSTDVDYYKIERGDTEGEVPALSWDSIATVNFGINTYQDTIPAFLETWDYRVLVVDDSSNISWNGNPTDSAYIPNPPTAPPPLAPSNLIAVGDTFAIHLTWNDNSSNEDGFYLFKDGIEVVVADLKANDESYTDSIYISGSSHTYQVSAYNEFGQSSRSNSASASTSDTTTFEGNIRYLSNVYTGKGANNGRSWDDAWGLGTIGQNEAGGNLQPNTIVYMDGGSTSLTYTSPSGVFFFEPTYDGTAGNLIIFKGSDDTGHNGEIIFDGQNQNKQAIDIQGDNYLSFEDITMRRFVNRTIEVKYPASYIYFKRIRIEGIYTDQGAFYINGDNNDNTLTNNIFIENCYVEAGNYSAGQVDLIYLTDVDHMYILNNILLQNNTLAPTTQHNDVIQAGQGSGTGNLVVAGNYIYHNYNTQVNANVLMWENLIDSVVVYNNIIDVPYHTGTNGNVVRDKEFVYNHYYTLAKNTIISNGSANMLSIDPAVQHFRAFNNIFNHVSQRSLPYQKQMRAPDSWSDWDGNFYGNYLTTSTSIVYLGGNKSMATLNGLGAELTGTPANRDRQNPLLNADFTPQVGSPVIGAGLSTTEFQNWIKSTLGGYLEWYDDNCGATLQIDYVPYIRKAP